MIGFKGDLMTKLSAAVLLSLAVLLISACEKKDEPTFETTESIQKMKDDTVDAAKEAAEATEEAAERAVDATKEAADEAVEAADQAVEEAKEAAN
jgi:hypothetical protein